VQAFASERILYCRHEADERQRGDSIQMDVHTGEVIQRRFFGRPLTPNDRPHARIRAIASGQPIIQPVRSGVYELGVRVFKGFHCSRRQSIWHRSTADTVISTPSGP